MTSVYTETTSRIGFGAAQKPILEVVSVYIHVPLCTRKCPYCHFYTIPHRPHLAEELLAGLFLELERVRPYLERRAVVSIYFGGGTPWLLGADRIEKLLQKIPAERDCEITLEANPQDVSEEGARAFAAAGINRLSIGVQSLLDAELALLGRTHSAEQGLCAVKSAQKGGIENISIDLMVDIPGQTMASFEQTLERLKDVSLDHLSLYNLTMEPKTAFYRKRKELQLLLPKDEVSTQMLLLGVERLAEMGYRRYEISAFAKRGRSSRHNLGYWTGREFLGLGPSAFSYVDGRRFQNSAHLKEYVSALQRGTSATAFEERLSCEKSVCERLAIGLRVLEGVDLSLFQPLPRELERTLEELKEEGYLHLCGTHARLTDRGLLFYDTAASEIVG